MPGRSRSDAILPQPQNPVVCILVKIVSAWSVMAQEYSLVQTMDVLRDKEFKELQLKFFSATTRKRLSHMLSATINIDEREYPEKVDHIISETMMGEIEA
jgi:hypothetical protein